jgi:tRNA-2-methylthio-N6-dimethylallyladenosine synthase
MNRRHTADDYRRLVDRLRQAQPALALSSDFIVGFPGETDEDFEQTLTLIRDVGYAQAYSFRYSARPGTPAAALDGRVPDEAMAERLDMLQDLIDAQQQAFNATAVGRVVPVLFDRRGRHPGQLVGRTPHLQGVHAEASDGYLGAVVPVRILALSANSLSGACVVLPPALAADGFGREARG